MFVRQPWLGWRDTAWPGYTSANGSDQPLGSFKAVYAKRATVVLREPNRISICADCRYQQIVEDGVVVSRGRAGPPSFRRAKKRPSSGGSWGRTLEVPRGIGTGTILMLAHNPPTPIKFCLRERPISASTREIGDLSGTEQTFARGDYRTRVLQHCAFCLLARFCVCA